jgi:hypothetical protein
MTVTLNQSGDSRNSDAGVTGQMLSATQISRGNVTYQLIAGIETARQQARIMQVELARAAGLSESTYRRIIRDPDRCSPTQIKQIVGAFRRLADRAPPSDESAVLMRSLYRLALGHVATALGVCPDEVMAQDHRRGATANAHYRQLATARQITIYLVNTGIAADAVRQRRLAEMLGMTPAGVCLAIRAIEGRRDDPDFDQLITRLEAHLQGGE